LLPKLPGQYVVYDCIDDYRLFEHLPNAVSHTQKWLLEKADFVFASSRRLYEKACGLRPANTVGMLSNGVDVDHWCSGDTRSELPPAIANMQHPIIGYFGTISHWLDTELIESMARRHPSWHFLFMGPAYRSKKLKRILHLSNIHWIGEQPYELLPSLASCFDVAWLPFRLTPMTKTINPVKVYEYLALGKRVVSPSLPDLERLGPYVILADDLQETESALVSAIESRLRKEDEAGCRAIAAEFSWDKLWNEAFTDLSAYLKSEMEVP
jgi:glycosyltransferase involved in cell wall biosynthesis